MRTITSQTQNAWLSSWKGGEDRPMVRATIQMMKVRQHTYNLADINKYNNSSSVLKGTGVFTSAVLGQTHQPIELPNIKSISWNRSTSQDIATCTITLFNTETLPMGSSPDDDGAGFERPGYFTFNRGVSTESQSRWNQQTNGWKNMLLPDRIIRTYEGYGYSPEITPELDPHMYPSGVWLIDDVAYDAQGLITLTCRDIGRILIDQIMFPPVVPHAQYPATWQTYHRVKNPDVPKTSSKWFRPAYATDSNIPYIGKGFSDGDDRYVQSNGAVRGHHGTHAFDSQPQKTYWLSVGNYPRWSSAYEYIQGRFSSRKVRAVKFRAWGGPYTYFISVYANGKWQGRSTIPYRSQAVDTNANIRFVKKGRVGKDAEIVVDIPDYGNATAVRITFTDLYDSGIGRYRWRAGVRDFQVNSSVTTYVSGGYRTEGNYGDYTDIIKYLCSWGGFFWPSKSGGNTVKLENGTTVAYVPPGARDPALPTGYVWGFLEKVGTAGKVDLGVEIWDKKPLMDGISYIRDITNYLFFIDELGRVVWRSPNIWSVGNYRYGPTMSNPVRTSDMVTIDEDQTLMGLTATVSARNVREKIFVANVNGKFGAMAEGYNPAPSGIRRVAGWTDQNFQTEKECQIMADLIAIRSMFTYRKNQLEIPGNPAIQCDDQIKILERTTGETYIHYVDGISSEFDMTTGRWTYSVETHWLGEEPFAKWAFNPYKLSQETQEYLRTIGKLPPL